MRDGVTIYFIRHGETDWNAEERYQGQADIPLNEKGRAQARRNGRALTAFLPAIATADFVASPLSRTRETMRIVRGELGLPPDQFRVDERLRELNYGHWEGQLASELPQLDPEGFDARALDTHNWRPRGGENYVDLIARAGPWLAEIQRDTVVVSHGGVSRALRGKIFGLSKKGIPVLDVPQDRVLIFTSRRMWWL